MKSDYKNKSATKLYVDDDCPKLLPHQDTCRHCGKVHTKLLTKDRYAAWIDFRLNRLKEERT